VRDTNEQGAPIGVGIVDAVQERFTKASAVSTKVP
jgi:hypothetical protein